MAQASQPASSGRSTAGSAADPLDHHILPLVVQKRLLNLLDARSLASSRCVSRRWLSRVDASSAWVRVAGSLGLATQPREMSRQRVFRMLGGECRVSVQEMEVTEQDGGLSESEVILDAGAENGRLKLLVLDQLRGSARICRLSVVNCDSPALQPQPPSGRQCPIESSDSGDFVLLPCDELWYALLPVRGVGNSTSPLLKLQHSFIEMSSSDLILHRCCRCSGQHLLGLASTTGRLNLLSVQPLVTKKQVRDHVKFDTQGVSVYRLAPPSGTSDNELVVAVLTFDDTKSVKVTFVRADCHRLHVLRAVTPLAADGFFEHNWMDGFFFTTEACPETSGGNRQTRLTRHSLAASGLVISDACEYLVPAHAAECPFELAGANATHFFAHDDVQDDGSYTLLMYRFGRQQPLRKIQMPNPDYAFCHSHTARWACGLDPTKGSNQLFFGTDGDKQFKPWCWEISFR